MKTFGQILLILLALGSALGTAISDFDRRHVFNPDWPAHARFHAAAYAVLNIFCSFFCVWLCAKEFFLAATLLLVLIGATLLVAMIVPGTSSIAGGNDRVYARAAISVWMSGLFVLLALAGGICAGLS